MIIHYDTEKKREKKRKRKERKKGAVLYDTGTDTSYNIGSNRDR